MRILLRYDRDRIKMGIGMKPLLDGGLDQKLRISQQDRLNPVEKQQQI